MSVHEAEGGEQANNWYVQRVQASDVQIVQVFLHQMRYLHVQSLLDSVQRLL
jgi:hypothetical protein